MQIGGTLYRLPTGVHRRWLVLPPIAAPVLRKRLFVRGRSRAACRHSPPDGYYSPAGGKAPHPLPQLTLELRPSCTHPCGIPLRKCCEHPRVPDPRGQPGMASDSSGSATLEAIPDVHSRWLRWNKTVIAHNSATRRYQCSGATTSSSDVRQTIVDYTPNSRLKSKA